jgi:WD40 repeat protein
VAEQEVYFNEGISRRAVLKVLAGLTITMGSISCAASASPAAPVTPAPTLLRLGTVVYTYKGHSDYATSVAWSPDGKRISSGSDDKTVQVWDAATGGNVFIYKGHTDIVRAVPWSPDARKLIASGSNDQTVQVWQARYLISDLFSPPPSG